MMRGITWERSIFLAHISCSTLPVKMLFIYSVTFWYWLFFFIHFLPKYFLSWARLLFNPSWMMFLWRFSREEVSDLEQEDANAVPVSASEGAICEQLLWMVNEITKWPFRRAEQVLFLFLVLNCLLGTHGAVSFTQGMWGLSLPRPGSALPPDPPSPAALFSHRLAFLLA